MSSYDLISVFGGAASHTLTSSAYLACYKQFLDSKANKLNDIIASISEGASQSVISIPNQGITAHGYVFSSVDIARAIRDGEDNINDVTGQHSVGVDDLLEEVGSNVSSASIQIAFVDALASTNDPAGATSVFSSLVSARIGQLTSRTSNFADMALSILSSSANIIDKLRTMFDSIIPSLINDSDANQGFKSITYECTGSSPASLFMEDIDMSAPFEAIGQCVVKAGKTIANMWNGIFKWGKKLVSKAVNAVEQFTVDPLDVSTNDEYEDYSFDAGVNRNPIDITGIGLSSNVLEHFNEHNGEYLTIPLLGGVIYISSDFKVYVKPHIYPINVARNLFNIIARYCLTLTNHWYQGSGFIRVTLDSFASELVNEANNICSFKINTGDEEKPLYQSMLYSKFMLCFSMDFMMHTDDEWELAGTDLKETVSVWYSLADRFSKCISLSDYDWIDYEDPDYTSNTLSYCYQNWMLKYIGGITSDSISPVHASAITNYNWLNMVCIDSGSFTVSQIPQKGISGIVNYIEYALGLETEEVFLPYTWRVGQYGGRYNIKSDDQNAEAFKNFLIAIVVVVVIAVAMYFGIRIRSKIKLKALEAERAFQLAMYNEDVDITQLRKMQKRTLRLSKMAGTNFADAAASASNLNFLNAEQGSAISSELLTVSNLTNTLESKINSNSDDITELRNLISTIQRTISG